MPSFAQCDRHLDMAGTHCPQPVLNCKATLAKMHPGEILRLTASDPDARREIPLLVAALQDEVLEIRSERGLMHFLIKRHGTPGKRCPPQPLVNFTALLRYLAPIHATPLTDPAG